MSLDGADRLCEGPFLDLCVHHGSGLGLSPAYRQVVGAGPMPLVAVAPKPVTAIKEVVKEELVGSPADAEAATSAALVDGKVEEMKAEGLTAPSGPLPTVLVGSADGSQRKAIDRALAGDSFVVRGPPGCGKTLTLANMAAALAASGRRVLVAAKMPVALQVFESKMYRQQVQPASGSNSVPVLTISTFMNRTGSRFRTSLTDKSARSGGGGGGGQRNPSLVSEARFALWCERMAMARFTLTSLHRNTSATTDACGADGGGTDGGGTCCQSPIVEWMGRGWRLNDPQPAELSDLTDIGYPCALLTPTCTHNHASSAAGGGGGGDHDGVPPTPSATPARGGGGGAKAQFVCGLCGKQQASLAPFVKHMSKHKQKHEAQGAGSGQPGIFL